MKIAILTFGMFIVIIFSLYVYYGGFASIDIKIEETGGEMLVYEDIKGEYSQSGKVMDKLYKQLLNEDQIETTKGFGIYYDNPRVVEKSQLRSEAGCVIEPNDTAKITALGSKYKVKIYPPKKYITTSFPFKGTLSIFVSVMRVYPALSKYAEENGIKSAGAVMELYDIPNGKTYYRQEFEE